MNNPIDGRTASVDSRREIEEASAGGGGAMNDQYLGAAFRVPHEDGANEDDTSDEEEEEHESKLPQQQRKKKPKLAKSSSGTSLTPAAVERRKKKKAKRQDKQMRANADPDKALTTTELLFQARQKVIDLFGFNYQHNGNPFEQARNDCFRPSYTSKHGYVWRVRGGQQQLLNWVYNRHNLLSMNDEKLTTLWLSLGDGTLHPERLPPRAVDELGALFASMNTNLGAEEEYEVVAGLLAGLSFDAPAHSMT